MQMKLHNDQPTSPSLQRLCLGEGRGWHLTDVVDLLSFLNHLLESPTFLALDSESTEHGCSCEMGEIAMQIEFKFNLGR